MARFSASGTTAAALANGGAIAAIVPAASTNFVLRRVVLGVTTAGNTPTDFQVGVGINRATARGTSSGTATVQKFDPNSSASVITAVDNAWSVQPTLAATDVTQFGFNSRGGVDSPFGTVPGADALLSTIGTANPIVLVQRSGAALPANHSITWTVEWDE
jgi:hypothetical protein